MSCSLLELAKKLADSPAEFMRFMFFLCATRGRVIRSAVAVAVERFFISAEAAIGVVPARRCAWRWSGTLGGLPLRTLGVEVHVEAGGSGQLGI